MVSLDYCDPGWQNAPELHRNLGVVVALHEAELLSQPLQVDPDRDVMPVLLQGLDRCDT